MKYLLYLIIGIPISIQGCKGTLIVEKGTKFEFTYLNNTSRQISLKGYYSGYAGNVFGLAPSDAFTQSFTDGGTSIIALSDSTWLTLDDAELIVYKLSDDSPFNILNWDNYELEVVDNVQKFTYTFTEADFE